MPSAKSHVPLSATDDTSSSFTILIDLMWADIPLVVIYGRIVNLNMWSAYLALDCGSICESLWRTRDMKGLLSIHEYS